LREIKAYQDGERLAKYVIPPTLCARLISRCR
jgi:hypothetical protein